MTAIRKHNNTSRPVQTSQTSQPKNVTLPRHDTKNGQCLEPAPQRKDQARKLVNKKTPQKTQRQAGNGYRKPKANPAKGAKNGSRALNVICDITSQSKKGIGGLINKGCTLMKAVDAKKNFAKQKTKAQKFDAGLSIAKGVNVVITDARKKGVAVFNKLHKTAVKNFIKKNPALYKSIRTTTVKALNNPVLRKSLKITGGALGVADVVNDGVKYQKIAKKFIKGKASFFKLYYAGATAVFGAIGEGLKYTPAKRFSAPFTAVGFVTGKIRDAIK